LESDSKRRGNPMGEMNRTALRVDFDHSLKLEFHGSKVTSDAGLLVASDGCYWDVNDLKEGPWQPNTS